jgi:hypothetical protein
MTNSNPNQENMDDSTIKLSSEETKGMDTKPESKNDRRTLWITIGGILFVACWGILVLGYVYVKTNKISAIAVSPVPTRGVLRNTPTPALGRQPTATMVEPPLPPILGSAEETMRGLENGEYYELRKYATYLPDQPEVSLPGAVYFYGIHIESSVPLLWEYGWCALTKELLEQNLSQMKIEFTMNGETIPRHYFATLEPESPGESYCRVDYVLIKYWPKGIHKLETNITFLEDTDDGWNIYPAGTHTLQFLVTVEN